MTIYAAHRAEVRPANSHNEVTMWSQNCVKVVQKLFPGSPKVILAFESPKVVSNNQEVSG